MRAAVYRIIARIVAALAAKVKVQAKEEEIFTQQIELRFVNAEMDPDQAARAANKILQRDEVFDARELRFALLRKLAATLREMGMDENAADADKLRHMLNVILTAHPELLYEAQKEALAANVEIEEADEELPPAITSEGPLPTSRLNVYRALPPGLNSWERDFAALLDADSAGVVQWWHRNPATPAVERAGGIVQWTWFLPRFHRRRAGTEEGAERTAGRSEIRL